MVRLDKFLVASILMLATRSSVMSAPAGVGDFLKACFGASCPVKNEPTGRNPSPQQSPISYTTSPNALPLKANQKSESGASDVVKSCSGASCPQNVKPADRNTPPQQSPSSGSHITSPNALPLKANQNSKSGASDVVKSCSGASCPQSVKPADRNTPPQQSPSSGSHITSPNALPLRANQNSKSVASDVVKSCSGASCPQNVKPADRNSPPQQSTSSGSYTTSQNALPLKSKPESQAGENMPYLDPNMWEEIYQRTPVADQKNFRLSNKVSSKFKPRVWELYCAQSHTDLDSSKAGLLVKIYNFCLQNYSVTFTYYPKIQACLDDVNEDLSLLTPSEFSFQDNRLIERQPDIIREILNRGLAPDALTRLLWLSATAGDVEMTKILLEHPTHKVDPNKSPSGHYPLIMAAFADNISYDGRSPPHVGRLECVKLLLQNGADPTVKSNDLKTPLEIATEKNNVPMIEVLTRTTRSL